MSLDYLNTQVDGYRAEADRVQSHWGKTVKEIDSDASLSAEGKKNEKAQWAESTRTKLKELRGKEEAAIDMKIRDLERQLDSKVGSTASDIIAFRDAQDRAERLDDKEEALRVLSRAIRNDDTTLAHAVFRRGLDANWREVTAMFGNEYPDKKTTVGDLAYLKAAKGNSFARSMPYMFMA